MLETDGLALTPGLAISGSLLMVAGLGLSHGWAALSRRGPTNGQRFVLFAAGEHMQRHQFCVATLSRNCAPGFMHRVLSGPFEDGSVQGRLS